MMPSEFWREVMDTRKRMRAEAKEPVVIEAYARAEMMARAEVEMAEAEEVVRARS